MKRTSNKLGSIILSLCEVVVGVLLLVNPAPFCLSDEDCNRAFAPVCGISEQRDL